MTQPPDLQITALDAEHWPRGRAIYEAGIAGGNATFEASAPGWEAFAKKGRGLPALAALDAATGAVLGWAALAPVSERAVYRGVASVSIYVDPAHAGRGVGRALLGGLVEAAAAAGLWTLEAGIFPENAASIAIHERCGFRRVGVRERVGQMPDRRWRDVVLFERRA